MQSDEASSNSDIADKVQWYVMRVYKREREAEELLAGSHGIEHFIAKRYEIRTYRGVKRSVLLPAIPSIIFVHASRHQIRQFKMYCPFLQYCFWSKRREMERPLVVPDHEMLNFIKIAQQVEENIVYLKPEEVQLSKGTKVRVHGGPFNGVEGTLTRVKGIRSKQVVVQLTGVAAVATTTIKPDLIEIVK